MIINDFFRIVFESVVYDHRHVINDKAIKGVVKVASLIKVLLHVLRVTGIARCRGLLKRPDIGDF